MMRIFLAMAASSLLIAAGCEHGDFGPPNPAPTVTTGSAAGGGGAGSGGAGATGGGLTIKREVFTRSPFGGQVGNLLADGDFEFSIQIEGNSQQTGWYAFAQGQTYLPMETGGLCRSGLRCAVLESNRVLFGRGTSAKDAGMLASVWAKPPAGLECSVILPSLTQCNFGGSSVDLLPEQAQPDSSGWCLYRAATGPRESSMCMFVESELKGGARALVDDARLLPDDGSVPRRQMVKPSPERAERFRKISRKVRDLLPLGPPSTSVQDKFGLR